jgi:hypothetical protein
MYMCPHMVKLEKNVFSTSDLAYSDKKNSPCFLQGLFFVMFFLFFKCFSALSIRNRLPNWFLCMFRYPVRLAGDA